MLVFRSLGHRNDYFDHTEPVTVEAQLIELLKYLLENESLHVLSEAAALEHFPDDVSPLIVLWQQEYVTLQGLSYERFFLRKGHVIENGLDGVGALFMAADLDEVVLDHFKNLQALLRRAVWEQLLEKVVSILVHHDLWKFAIHLLKQELDECWVGFSELLLQIAGAGLGCC